MVAFPNAKINIGLQITGKRPDGYHDLESVFFPVAIKDAVEVIESPASDKLLFSISGNGLDISAENNICVKAFNLLKKDFPEIPGIKMHLHKHIPSGAGLGGGSADATATLQLLNIKFQLDISRDKITEYAALLGSDCPFFVINKPCLATGRGEVLQEIPLDLSACEIMIVHPGIHISTTEAFAAIDATGFSPAGKLKANTGEDISQWRELIKNDFEANAFLLYPQLSEIKEKMYRHGAFYSAMSGSGSTIYGIFPKNGAAGLKFPGQWFCQTV